MVNTNLSQHEQHLKLLEKSIREICDKHREVNDALHDQWNMLNDMWSQTMQLFIIVDDLRTPWLKHLKDSQES